MRLASGSSGLGGERRHAGVLGVGVGEAGVEPGAAQHHSTRCSRSWRKNTSTPGTVDSGLEPLDDSARLGVGDAPGAPVGDRAVGVEGGQVAAGGDVAGAQLEVEAGGGECAAPELELLGVVAEQPEMTGSRAGRDPGADRLDQAGGALADELVEIRGGGLFELGAVLGVGVAAQTVHHHEQDLGVGRLDQRREVHALTLVSPPSALSAPALTWSSTLPGAARAARRSPVISGANALGRDGRTPEEPLAHGAAELVERDPLLDRLDALGDDGEAEACSRG